MRWFEVDTLVRPGPLLGLLIVLVFAFAVLGSGVLANNEVGPIVALFFMVALGALAFEAWCCANGRTVTTSDRIVGLHRLLTEIERRAPHVRVLS